MTKIKEWLVDLVFWNLPLWIFLVGVGIGFGAGYLYPNTPDQPKTSMAETNIAEPMVLYERENVDIGYKPPFNPATMEITRVDTVGWEKTAPSRLDTVAYSINGLGEIFHVSTERIITGDSTWSPILDSTIVPKTSPLLTREENKQLMKLLED